MHRAQRPQVQHHAAMVAGGALHVECAPAQIQAARRTVAEGGGRIRGMDERPPQFMLRILLIEVTLIALALGLARVAFYQYAAGTGVRRGAAR